MVEKKASPTLEPLISLHKWQSEARGRRSGVWDGHQGPSSHTLPRMLGLTNNVLDKFLCGSHSRLWDLQFFTPMVRLMTVSTRKRGIGTRSRTAEQVHKA